MSKVTIICLCALEIALTYMLGLEASSGLTVMSVGVVFLGIGMSAYLITRIIRHGHTIIDIITSVLFILATILAVMTWIPLK